MRNRAGRRSPVTIGDMSEVKAEGTFDFVFLIFNTLYNLTSQAAQVKCFRNAAGMLAPGGAFLIEAFIPDLLQFHDHRSVKPRHISFGALALEAAVHDPVTQRIDYQVLRVTSRGTQLTPLPMRYAWPQETDLMAQLAGLELENRWGGWDKSAFTANSRMHISVYRKPA